MSVTKTETKTTYSESENCCSVEFDPGRIESFVLIDSTGSRSERMNELELRSFLQILQFLKSEGTI